MEFTLRDFINLEKTMASKGSICIHDVLPFNYVMTTRDTSYVDRKLAQNYSVCQVLKILGEHH